MKEHLLIFTRYPTPGETKTRLIPHLGAEKACELYQHMAKYTFDIARKIIRENLEVLALLNPGEKIDECKTWLGEDLEIQPQADGDLGNKLQQAFASSFSAGISKVIAIGTDCVELDVRILNEAFQLLDKNDAVIGPAEDGGYYLIGLRKFIPEVFEDIPWSSENTLHETCKKFDHHRLTYSRLPTLSDIDTPEDLNKLPQSFDFILDNPSATAEG